MVTYLLLIVDEISKSGVEAVEEPLELPELVGLQSRLIDELGDEGVRLLHLLKFLKFIKNKISMKKNLNKWITWRPL